MSSEWVSRVACHTRFRNLTSLLGYVFLTE